MRHFFQYRALSTTNYFFFSKCIALNFGNSQAFIHQTVIRQSSGGPQVVLKRSSGSPQGARAADDTQLSSQLQLLQALD